MATIKTPSVILKGSEKKAPKGKKIKQVNSVDSIDITVRIRRKKDVEEALKEVERTGHFYSRDEYVQEFGSDEKDIQHVEDFASANALSVSHVSMGRRSMMLSGTAENFSKAFGVKLNYYKNKKGQVFRGRTGAIKIPKELEGIIESVMGLDNRMQVRPKFRKAKVGKVKSRVAAKAFYPTELAKLYNFPQADGEGQTIGIIEFGGGHTLKDIKHYFNTLKLPMPVVKSVSVGTAHNNPGTSDDDEVMLDIEVAAAVAPKSTIVMYYAPNTSKGFVDAITQPVHDNVNKPSVISISWGAAENEWTSQIKNSINEACKSAALLGVTICISAGDSGSDDSVGDGKVHVDFPGSSPYVLTCGGTKLIVNGSVLDETVWNEASDSSTGGGVSDFFALPDYQVGANVPLSLNKGKFKGRGVPDVAGVADPVTGYKIYMRGKTQVIGGTSAVAPLMAGLIARINQLKNKPSGFINPKIYKAKTAFRDIKRGDNITTSTDKGYAAQAGWDGATGLGVADGTRLLNVL